MSLLTFRKDERLARKKDISKLFREGDSFFTYPLKIYWRLSPSEHSLPLQVLIIVGKRSFKRAVDRNKIRRQIREIYRQNKTGFYQFLQDSKQSCQLCIIYTASLQIDYHELEKKIKLVFRRLENDIDIRLNNNNRTLSE